LEKQTHGRANSKAANARMEKTPEVASRTNAESYEKTEILFKEIYQYFNIEKINKDLKKRFRTVGKDSTGEKSYYIYEDNSKRNGYHYGTLSKIANMIYAKKLINFKLLIDF
jgi:hypothetical protein